MDQMKIIFTTVHGLKSVAEEEIGVEPHLLPLADLKNRLIRMSVQLQEKKSCLMLTLILIK